MFALKVTLEVIAVVLLLVGYLHEDKLIAFERNLWKKLRVRTAPKKPALHSATYYASRKAEQRAWNERERIAKNAAYARSHAVLQNSDHTTQRVA